MSSEIIRVAIGGQGRSGYKIHADWLQQVPDKYKIVAVADEIEARLIRSGSDRIRTNRDREDCRIWTACNPINGR